MSRRRKIIVRVAVGLTALGLLPVLPWWFCLGLFLALTLVFENYYEVLLFGVFLDVIYGVPIPIFNSFRFVFFAIAAVFLVGSLILKQWLAIKSFI